MGCFEEGKDLNTFKQQENLTIWKQNSFPARQIVSGGAYPSASVQM